MASSGFMHLLLFFLFAALASSASISNNVFELHGVTGRSLLQQKAACPVNFENQNYTIMTSQCKGPNYQARSCCGAFKQLACPFSEQLNDLKNDCASTLFSYINVYGKYPPGLFASLCREDQDGIDCEETLKKASQNTPQKNGATTGCSQSLMLMLMLAAGFLMLLFTLF